MTISYEHVQKICTDFVNDSDTIIGMQCDWHDYLVQEVLLDFNSEEFMHALRVDTDKNVVCMPVEHENYGEMNVYIRIYDKKIRMSTKHWLLK
jgi:hypothetical protein